MSATVLTTWRPAFKRGIFLSQFSVAKRLQFILIVHASAFKPANMNLFTSFQPSTHTWLLSHLPSCPQKNRRRHHSSCHVRPRSWRTTPLETDHVKARLQRRHHLFFQLHRLQQIGNLVGCEVPAQLVSALATRLLQLCSGSSSSVHY